MRRSLGSQLDAYDGIGPGFDFLRLSLALTIMALHAFWLSGHSTSQSPLSWFADYSLVPMFFALSGFLVTASSLRLSLTNFLVNRGLRIVPALAVDVVFCALILGPVFTTLTLPNYFGGQEFWSYFLNVLGWPHYRLPGVFEDHPTYQVNVALWTVPYELLCYAILSALIVVRLIHKPRVVALGTLAFMLAGWAAQTWEPYIPKAIYDPIHFVAIRRGGQAITTFLLGIVIYHYRYHIPYDWKWAVCCGAVVATGATGLWNADIENLGSRLILLPPLGYITIFVGLTRIHMPRLVTRGDYSYGIYLYHAPLIQALIAIAPSLFLDKSSGFLWLLASEVVAVCVFASLSWHLVEKPILRQRKRFSLVAQVRDVSESR